jgi:hypothetical protein
MSLQREIRFRRVSAISDRPMSGRAQNPMAYTDHVRELITDDCPTPTVPAAVHSGGHSPLSARRDPNRQSDPVASEAQHPWNKSRIRHCPQPDRSHTPGTGKRIVLSHQQSQNGSAIVPSSADSIGGISTTQTSGPRPDSAAPRRETESGVRYREQAAGSDWFALTNASPFEAGVAGVGICRTSARGAPVPNAVPLVSYDTIAAAEPGIQKRPGPAPRMRVDSGTELRRQLQLFVARRGGCCSDLWNATVAGDISKSAFDILPTDRLRKSLPLTELARQLAKALDAESVDETTLATCLGLGLGTSSLAPVRYANFVMLWNA